MDELVFKVMLGILAAKWVILKNSALNLDEAEYVERWVRKHCKDDFKDENEAFTKLLNEYVIDKLIEAEMLG